MQLLVKRAVDLAERAGESWAIECTDFLAPPLVADVKANTHKLADVGIIAWGGFPQAERCRLCIGNSELLAAAEADLEEASSKLQFLQMYLIMSTFLLSRYLSQLHRLYR